jgi:hypothetical protein
LPAPVAVFMWAGAFGPEVGTSAAEVISVGLGVAAIVLSVTALVRETVRPFELKGNRAGLAFAILGIILYLEGTSFNSGFLHSVSIAMFYSGSVLYLVGPRALIPALPAGLIVASSFAPATYGLWGTLYLEFLSWAVAVVSAGILWVRRKPPQVLECFLCRFFRGVGRSYCSACGISLAPPSASLPRRRLLGFAAFAVAMIVALSLTIPLATGSPNVSLVNYGLGGPAAGQFAPLPGWGVSPTAPSVTPSGVGGYSLTRGINRIEAFVSVSAYPGSALSAVGSTMTHPVRYSKLPGTLSPSLDGYTFTTGGTKYVGVQGVFAVGLLNGTVGNAYLAVSLSETADSFARDNGTALFSAASNVVSWASGWGSWSSTVGSLQFLYQIFTQLAYAGSISVFGIALFTIARDDELTKVRRVEALRGLGAQETLILRILATASNPLLGEQLYEKTKVADLTITAPAFYSSVDELSRRDLVSPSLVRRRGTWKMFWKCMV